MNEQLLSAVSKNLLFRYSLPLWKTDMAWARDGVELPAKYRLPHFGCFEQQAAFADVRAAWHGQGILVAVDVSGKKQKVRCNPAKILQSDGVQMWIDTRNIRNVHRASRFCHWFAYIPLSGNVHSPKPLGTMLKINRAKEDAKTFQLFKPLAASRITHDGYHLSWCIPAAALTGWNPAEHRQIGFNYAVVDGEFGWQTLATDFKFPIAEDPSLWHTLELTQ